MLDASMDHFSKITSQIEEDIINKISNNVYISVDDFQILKVIGRGSYGKVLLVKKNDSDEILAMKILKKKEMSIRNQVLHIKTERKIMEVISHPFTIKLKYAFQNKQKLYLLSEFCQGGELFFHLQRIVRFNEEAAKFYCAQVILALEHLHSNNIIYRE